QIGASRLAFPRLAGLSLWLFVAAGGLLVTGAFARGGAAAGSWSMGHPIPTRSLSPGHGADFWIMGVALAGVAVLVASVNLIVTVVKLRAPGLTLSRTPLFTWSTVVSSAMFVLATPVLLTGLVLLFVDRHYGGHVFTVAGGGRPDAWR